MTGCKTCGGNMTPAQNAKHEKAENKSPASKMVTHAKPWSPSTAKPKKG